MDKKRWVAVGVASGLVLLSGVSSLMSLSKVDDRYLDSVTEMISGTNSVVENVLSQGDETKIVQLEINGTIQASTGGGLFSSVSYDHDFFIEQLEAIKADPEVKGILLKVNTPGGGVYESAEIKKYFDEFTKTNKIPIYVSMTGMAASGGYYVSAGADKIFATEETITGSIGVILSGMNYSGLFEKLGITDTSVKSGELKDMGSGSRPMTEKDRAVLQSMIDSSYGRFVKNVSEGRGLTDEEVRKLADGRIYDGAQAKEVGLVDEIGYPEDALAALKADKKLKNATVVQYEVNSSNWMSSIFGNKVNQLVNGKNAETELVNNLIKTIGTDEAPRMMYLYGGE